mgnify:CR=1 FL=1
MPWAYCWPYPVGTNTYLCSYGGGKGRFRISLIDERGNRATVSGVLVGEVWILAGQSNMQYGLGGVDGWADARARSAKGELSALRFFRPDQESRSPTPLADLKAGAWHATTDTEAFGRLSAAGFHFAEALLPALKVPVGLVNIPRGGTQMFQWVDEATFASDGRFAACLKAKGKKKAPCEDWNGKVAPLAGLAVRGVVWYQGESDSWNPYPSSNFAPMLEKMIACWRKAWGNPDLPFVIAQLPSMAANHHGRPVIRVKQLEVSKKLTNVGVANITDTGWKDDVHPHDKKPVGERPAQESAQRRHLFRTAVGLREPVDIPPQAAQPGREILADEIPIARRVQLVLQNPEADLVSRHPSHVVLLVGDRAFRHGIAIQFLGEVGAANGIRQIGQDERDVLVQDARHECLPRQRSAPIEELPGAGPAAFVDEPIERRHRQFARLHVRPVRRPLRSDVSHCFFRNPPVIENHEVELRRFGRRNRQFQQTRMDAIVRIDHQHVLPRGHRQRRVTRRRQALVRLMDAPERERRRTILEDLSRPVRAAVIDGDHLEVSERLPSDGIETTAQMPRDVVDGKDDRHLQDC